MDIKTLCLGALSLGEASGYDIKKVFEGAFAHFFAAGFGSIYPALADLTQKGLIVCTDVEQEKRPAKKLYRLTDKGREHLLAELRATPPRYKVRSEFLVLMFFAELLPPERLREVFAERKADIQRKIAEVEGVLNECDELSPGMRFCGGYGLSQLYAGLEFIEQHEAELLASSNNNKEG